MPGLLGLVATVAVAAAGLRVPGLGVFAAIGFALAIAWAAGRDGPGPLRGPDDGPVDDAWAR